MHKRPTCLCRALTQRIPVAGGWPTPGHKGLQCVEQGGQSYENSDKPERTTVEHMAPTKTVMHAERLPAKGQMLAAFVFTIIGP